MAFNKKGGALTSSHENLDSTVDQDSLFHRESLFIVSSSNSESVILELGSYDFTIDIRSHSSVVEVTTIQQYNVRANLESYTYLILSSSISITFCYPVVGLEMLYYGIRKNVRANFHLVSLTFIWSTIS